MVPAGAGPGLTGPEAERCAPILARGVRRARIAATGAVDADRFRIRAATGRVGPA
jgi:hypothetical protein